MDKQTVIKTTLVITLPGNVRERDWDGKLHPLDVDHLMATASEAICQAAVSMTDASRDQIAVLREGHTLVTLE